MQNFVIILILAAIIGFAIWYVYKAKKSGRKCIGCSAGCCKNCEVSCCCGKNDD